MKKKTKDFSALIHTNEPIAPIGELFHSMIKTNGITVSCLKFRCDEKSETIEMAINNRCESIESLMGIITSIGAYQFGPKYNSYIFIIIIYKKGN